jgi:putative ABC transport system permease protein
MLTVTLADLAYRYRQFLIAVVGAGVVMAMALLLAGLVGGFGSEIQQTMGGVGGDHWVLATASAGRIQQVAVFPQTESAVVSHAPGVTQASPLVLLPQEVARVNGKLMTVVVIGAPIGGLGDPAVTSGSRLSAPGQVVVNSGTGATVGSQMEIGATSFHVVGVVQNRTLLGGTSVVYMPLVSAQSVGLGGRPLITAVVTKGAPQTVPAGLQAFTTPVAEQRTLDSLASAVSSIDNTKILMWVIAGIIIAALLYVSALQRVRDFAVLKALGSSTLLLLGSLALQSVFVALLAAAFAAFISNFMGGIFQQPVAIPGSAFVSLPIIAVVVGLIASLVALRQATGADPAAAFG